jgi:hypothetical protein
MERRRKARSSQAKSGCLSAKYGNTVTPRKTASG